MSHPTDNDNQPVAVIVPGPAAAPDEANGRASRSRPWRLVSIGLLCVMLLVLIAVVVILPEMVAERAPDMPAPKPTVAPAISTSTPPAADAQRLAKKKREAERMLGIVLRKQTELEAEGVATWGGQDYDHAMDSLALGDTELQAGRFAEALQSYEKVDAELDALRDSMGERLASALDTGDSALAAEDGPAAREAFAIALAVEPHNQRAQQGMLRARVLEEVVALIAEGAGHEARGELDAAKQKYDAALALDARAARASAALENVVAQIRQREFHAAMSAALTALAQGDFATSRAALSRADSIQPGSPEVADGSKRLQIAVQASRIKSYRNEARSLESAERWTEAAERYAAVLAIDSNVAFARAGQDRSLARARIHRELDAYLAALDRLSTQGPRDGARRLLTAAANVEAKAEPKLAAKVQRLAAALKIAETPLQVRLQSDNLTDVTVYKVGRFGRFSSRDLLLQPGSYVAVGTRTGYRDVRVEFTVTGGEEPGDIIIRCQEKI